MNPLIIEWIYNALVSNDIKLALINALKTYYKNQSLKAVFDSENISEKEIHQPYSVFNPNILKKLTSILKPSELSILQNEINKFKNPINSFKNSIMSTEIRTVKNYVNKFDNLFKENEEEIPDNAWEVLSSSWFKKGRFTVDNKNLKIGTLTTLFQSDNDKRQIWYGPYTYPTFPQEIWILMTQAKGKNGSGAGTIFWKFWNRKWLPSQLRKYVKSELAKKGKYYGSQDTSVIYPNNINVQKTMHFINRLEKGFFKLKEYKTLSKNEIGSTQWRYERKQLLKNSLHTRKYIKIKRNSNFYKTWK
ncbi:hypothetical protein [Spiroplasma endosymbiont of Danaus chrysippus]|uniref:hypothetical protein n=1 Tax=Spiroplasma endosymbiont of Danaus chrysippus TaxID=2691041 RepID=UPI0013CD9274|nr:hypothetical protein [Spiroplasma endosymbiont of Danaus chrysippus]CAB1054372.1 hypothetical protein [Spiroplasma endosymbiont of Danaus chrysippus]